MCPNPFSSGGGSSTTSTAASSNATTVNVSTSTPINFDTHDLADAIAALAGSQQAGAVETAHAQLAGSALAAAATVQAAQIAAHSGPNLYLIGGALVAILGLAFTAGLIKLPRALRA